MSKLSRRDVVLATAAAAACGGPDMPLPIKFPQSARPYPRPPYPKNPVYHQQPPIFPIHLSGNVVLRSGTQGAPPIAAFKNPSGQDMELLEVKFEVSGPAITNTVLATAAFGGTVACQLMLGSYKITNGSVPVWGFGRAENLEAENKYDKSTGRVYCAYNWRLPRPMYIPAGALMAPSFTHTGYVSSTLNVRVGYSARSVLTKPKVVCIPWVANYASKAFNPIQDADTDQSTELDLVNDTDKLFNLQRFTGRTLYIDTTGVSSDTLPESFASQSLQLKMVDSYGRPIIRTNTPFRSAFSALTRSWELEDVGAQLDPGAYYRVFLKKDAATMPGVIGTGQAFVSMVGWREEPV